MLKNWWKILTVVILLYVIVAGFLAPLNPGIERVTPGTSTAGDLVVMNIRGYNTHFNSSNDITRVWLKFDDDHAIQATQVMAADDRKIRASFYIPTAFPSAKDVYTLSLITDNEIDGVSVLPSALFVSKAKEVKDSEIALWKKTPIVNLHARDSFGYPYRNILVETIRNVYFHVPMWFGMILLLAGSVFYSWRYIKTEDLKYDARALSMVQVGVMFGVAGLITGMLWAKHTWGAYWNWDIKQTVSAIVMLMYTALLILRSSFDDEQRRARLASGYNIFAFLLMIPLLFIVPRMADSLHPGNGGNPALGSEDMDNTMRMVFYPAVIGFTLLGLWISQLIYRFQRLKERMYN